MSGTAEKLRLKEMAEEDIYFARRDRELIRELQHRSEHTSAHTPTPDDQTRNKRRPKPHIVTHN